MQKLKVMSIFGTRPEATKMAPLIKVLERTPQIESCVTVTAQHREMLDQALEIFKIKPDFDLNIMKQSQTLSEITVNVLNKLNELLSNKDCRPDLILVHGDTTTTFASALAAFYHKIAVGHVEAGLRTFDKLQPYPEEMNRCLTTVLADLYFAPTALSKQNLLNENINENKIYITGNTALDAFKYTMKPNYVFKEGILNKLDYSKKIILMTAHRGENLGQPIRNICSAANEICRLFPEVEIVYAVHKNPALRKDVFPAFADNPRVHLTEPLDTEDMHNLMSKSYLVLTDSGGLQEEAPGLGKPVIVMRNITERPEGEIAGTLKRAGTEVNDIVREVSLLLTDAEAYNKMVNAKNPFGDGNASERIVDAILFHYGFLEERPNII